jgi:hypothetical protein
LRFRDSPDTSMASLPPSDVDQLHTYYSHLRTSLPHKKPAASSLTLTCHYDLEGPATRGMDVHHRRLPDRADFASPVSVFDRAAL